MRKIGLIVLLPFLPLALFVDIVFGDAVTGVRRTAADKLLEHKRMFVSLWNGA